VAEAIQRVNSLQGGALDIIHTSDGQQVNAIDQQASSYTLLQEKPGRREVRYYLMNVAKRAGSRYEHKRSRHWLKMKCEAGQELVIGGFTDPDGERIGLGALLVGYFESDDFVFAGKVGTGFDTKLLRELRARLDGLERGKPPFTKGSGLPRKGVHWVRPELVAEVAFMEWTGHGKLRHPRFVRLRDDKPAREVTREATPERP
jgi:bifunctional non-homologous end joining protein LigD